MSPRAAISLKFAAVAVLLLAQAGAAELLDRVSPRLAGDDSTRLAEAAPVPARLVQAVSFGHLPSVVDSLWLRAHPKSDVYRGPKRTAADPRDPLYYDFDLITQLDPLYETAYLAGSIFLSVIRKDPPGAVRLLERGAYALEHDVAEQPAEFKRREWRRSWDLLTQLGYNYLYELEDAERASRVLLAASREPGAPEYLGWIAKRVSQPDGAYQLGLRLLNGLLGAQPKDSPLARELEKKRLFLYVSQYLFNLNRDFRKYLGEIPAYRASASVSPADMQRYWKKFASANGVASRDPFGGTLSLDERSARINSSTPHDRVWGLD
jgi:hypothetical protein